MKALISKQMCEEVMTEFEAETGKPISEMLPAEFSDRMMKKVKITDDQSPQEEPPDDPPEFSDMRQEQ